MLHVSARVGLVLAVGLAGCSCPDGEPTAITSCLAPTSDPTAVYDLVPPENEHLDHTVTGTVETVGDEAKDLRCFESPASAGGWTWPGGDEAFYVSIRDDQGELWTLATAVPDGLSDIAVGDDLSVRFTGSIQFTWGPSYRSITVTREAQPILWVAAGAASDGGLAAPGYELSRGDSICRDKSSCGKWKFYDLKVDSGEARATAGWRSPASIGDDLIYNGGTALQEDSIGSGCADWFMDQASAAIVYGAAP